MPKLSASGLFLLASVAMAQTGFPACTANPDVAATLDQAVAAAADPQLPFASRMAPFRELLELHPADPFVHRAWLAHFAGYSLRPLYDKEVPRYIALYGARPEDPAPRFLFAVATQYRDPVKSRAMLEDLAGRQLRAPWTHVALAFSYAGFAPADPARSLAHSRSAAQICPESLDHGLLQSIAAHGDEALKRQTAERLRKQLAGRGDTAALLAWPVLWEMEFQVTPAAGHDELRARIRRDVAALREVKSPAIDRKLDTMRQGCTLANDLEGRHQVAQELARTAPGSAAAADAAIELWEEQNPYPDRSAPWSEIAAYQARQWSAAKEWIDRWPNYGPAWNAALTMVRADPPNRELLGTLGRRLSAFLRTNPDFTLGFTDQPTLPVAESLAAAGVDLDLVPELLAAAGRQAQERHSSDELNVVRPLRDADVARNFRSESWMIQKARAVWQARKGENEAARAALAALLAEAGAESDSLLAWRGVAAAAGGALLIEAGALARQAIVRMNALLDAEPTASPAEQRMHAMHEAECWQSRARLAELENRGADAVAFYLRAAAATPRNFNPAGRSRFAGLAGDVWRKMGGSSEGWQAYNVDQLPSQSDAPWRPVGTRMPDFTLEDTGGHPVRAADLRGKTIFINVWATWCGPCQGELPWVQKLFDSMKGRSDVAVLTFNVDENPGVIARYMREHGFTFPVVLAQEYIGSAMKVEAIPRNWIVDAAGVLRFERQAGFDDTFVKDSAEALLRAR